MSTSHRKGARLAPPPTPPASSPVPVFIYPGPPDHVFGWAEIAAALIRSKGITTGWWRIGAQLRFGAITARMGEPRREKNASATPTALVGFDALALFASTQGGDLVFDAANNCTPVPASAVASEPDKTGRKRAASNSKGRGLTG